MRNRSISLAKAGLLAASLFTAGCGLHHHDSSPSTSFTFRSTPSTDYVQVDRVGMPGVNTAVITSKDAYNAATPTDDNAGLFVSQIQTDVMALHTKLDAAITSAGFTPASTATSMAQAGPLIVPDELSIDTTHAAGFPNGRQLTDPVMDITLAVILLDLGHAGQSATSFSSLPLNPPANDVAFQASFPYLAAPH